ncbi:putative bifunctional diguanylate cyclase/phosphodiesterase [Parasphingorhabdus sp.]|uniref:putative bifunctional diguanylate cyclase/phosphodiesterase n=1 Tax=Parasphingorhabdus sp. TaxID=2709688 RepID=UPI003A931489
MNEKNRLASLYNMRILDTDPQDMFDRVTDLCAEIFDCPVALISLLDDERQWFLSSTGVDIRETPREYSFCDHTIACGGSLLVANALEDERFANNPFVTASPRMRSYMGRSLQNSDGAIIGSLCVIDPRPGHFSVEGLAKLSRFASVVEDLLRCHVNVVQTASLNTYLEETAVALRKSNRLLAQTEKIANIGSWEVDVVTREFVMSDQAYAIFGLSPETRLNIDQAVSYYAEEDQPVVREAVANASKRGGSFTYEVNLKSEDGLFKRIRGMGEFVEAAQPGSSRIVGVLKDISESHLARIALQRSADYDSLTNLYNRRTFDRLLAEKLDNHHRWGEDLIVLLMDLDGFKDINDTFGHQAGDEVLEELSARISASIPPEAIAARWGGDEFAIIAPLGASAMEATEIGETILEKLGADIEICGRKMNINATCGMAKTDDFSSGKELIRRADLALYNGKEREPGCVHSYEPTLDLSNHIRHEAMMTVRSALNENRIYAGYQPIVEISSNRIVGLEALMRLKTRKGANLTANQVMPAIQDPILSREISDRMLGFLCQDLADLRTAQPTLKYISINATEADLLSRDFAPKMLKSLADANIAPRNVTLEVTETMLMVNDTTTVQNVLNRLQAAGIRIALDDFGTGFSSLSHLRDFPIEIVKIDGSFIQSICSEHQTRLIVQALIAMAKNLKIAIVAEGIETEEQRRLLTQMGCDFGQGFLIGKVANASDTKSLRFGKHAAIVKRVEAA